MGLFSFFGSTPPPALEEKTAQREAVEVQLEIKGDAHTAPSFDAVAVLEAAGVNGTERERVDRALELLNVLPADASPQLRKSIVEASLKAFDVSIRAIVHGANAHVAAFETFIDRGHNELDELRAQSLARVAELEAEIARIRKRLDVATSDQGAIDQAALVAVERVRPVLVFFAESETGGAKSLPATASTPASTSISANDGKNGHPASIIIDESLLRAG